MQTRILTFRADRQMGRLFSMVLAVLLSAGCTAEKKTAPAANRICSLSAAASVILCKLGAAPAAVDHYSSPFVPAGIPTVGKGTALQLEKILELGIDTLVVWSYQVNALSHLKRHGIRIMALEPVRMKNYPELVKQLALLAGKEKEGRELVRAYEQKIPHPASGSAPKRVYLELYSRNRGAGESSYAGDLLRAAGGQSILKNTSLAGTEYIIGKNPEIIFVAGDTASVREIMERPGFSTVEAVRRKTVFPVPRRLLVEGAFPAEAVEYFKKRIQ